MEIYLASGSFCSALALAPLVDRGLAWFTVRFNFESQGKASYPIDQENSDVLARLLNECFCNLVQAFFMVVGFCLGLAGIMFLVVTLLWA